jgi:hypothetical protein
VVVAGGMESHVVARSWSDLQAVKHEAKKKLDDKVLYCTRDLCKRKQKYKKSSTKNMIGMNYKLYRNIFTEHRPLPF